VASVALGAVLINAGLKRRGFGGAAAALVGGALVYRGATGHSFMYDRLGVSTGDSDAVLDAPRRDVTSRAATVNARKAIKVEHRVSVAADRKTSYNYWRQFENLPQFMDHLASVEQTSPRRSHWTSKLIAGRGVEWDTELVNDIPDKLIAWKTIGRASVPHAGSVHFDETPTGSIVRMVLEYEPPAGRSGRVVARMFGKEPDEQVREDLERFRECVEQQGLLRTP
jgi:uncharacterized membrane protein